MREDEEKKVEGLTRRQALKASGLALGGLAVGGALIGTATAKGDGSACSDESCQDSCPPWTGVLLEKPRQGSAVFLLQPPAKVPALRLFQSDDHRPAVPG